MLPWILTSPPEAAEAAPVEPAPTGVALAAEAPSAAAPEHALTKGEEVILAVAEPEAKLSVEAYRALEDEFLKVAQPDDLRREDFEAYEKVTSVNWSLCARCKWVSGCDRCDEDKAWSFACRSTLWHSANEAQRPAAKPKGTPNKAKVEG